VLVNFFLKKHEETLGFPCICSVFIDLKLIGLQMIVWGPKMGNIIAVYCLWCL